MKKITCMAIMAAMLLMAIPAQAQFSWGIKGGVNLGGNDLTMLTNKKSAFDATNYTGFFIGPKAEVRIPVLGLGIELAAMYAQKGMVLTDLDIFKQNSIQIPLNIKYSLGLGNVANFFIAAGPEFGYNVGETGAAVQLESGEVKAYLIDEYALSINAGLGFTLFNHLQIGVNYNMPWGKSGEVVYLTKDEIQNAEDIKNGEKISYGAVKTLLKTGEKLENAVDNIKAGSIQVTLAYLF